jgi:hypothetical protein
LGGIFGDVKHRNGIFGDETLKDGDLGMKCKFNPEKWA